MSISSISTTVQTHERLLNTVVIDPTLLISYTFENDSGTTATNDGTLAATGNLTATSSTILSQTPAKIGSYCYYNATTHSANTGTGLSFGTSFTISFFFKSINGNNSGTLFTLNATASSNDLLYVFCANNSVFQVQFGSLGGVFPASSQGQLTTGMTNWEHFGMTYNRSSGAYKIYVNGSNVLNGTRTSSINPNRLYLGNKSPNSAAGGIYKGYIDQFRIYNTILTDAQVLTLSQQT